MDVVIINNLLGGFKEIFSSFLTDKSLLWYLAPIFLLWILLEIYFGRYAKEELGWNTALGNGITLLWINIESMRFLFLTKPDNFGVLLVIISVIMIYSLTVIYFAFSHKIPKKYEFLLGDPSPTYFLAMVSTLFGHAVLNVNLWVIIDLAIFYVVTLLFFWIIKLILPDKEDLDNSTAIDDFKPVDNSKFDDLNNNVGLTDNMNSKDDNLGGESFDKNFNIK